MARKKIDKTDEPVFIQDMDIDDVFNTPGNKSKVRVVKPAPVINVIVRTHRRESYFNKCIDSIVNQDYPNKKIHVTADDAMTAEYVKRAIKHGLVDFYYRVDGGMLHEPKAIFDKLVKRELCKPGDYFKARYNLYLNHVIERIPNGWIFIIDDDKELPHSKFLSDIAKLLISDNLMLIGQYAMKSKTVPEGDMWERLPFTRGHIDMSCFLFHVKFRDDAVFDAHKASDWRVANRLAAKLDLKWVKEPFVIADNDGNFGRSALRQAQGPSIR